eukprot:6205058-Pleurochrysis_carterae.AAC.1
MARLSCATPMTTCSLSPQFHADGHFHCADYPGHFTYELDGLKLTILWGKYGTYDLDLDVEARVANGSLRGNAASWRKLTYIEALPAFIHKANACGHAH